MRPVLACTLLALTALAPGCGDDEKDGGGRAVSVQAGDTLPVTGKEYSFDPARVTVAGGGGLTIKLKNSGSLAHNLKLEKDGAELGGTPTFPGGQTRSGSVDLKPGKYRMVCTVGNHEQLGMTGDLTVSR